MTETAPKYNYSRITNILFIIGIAVVLVFLIRSCGNEKSASIAYKNIEDRLQKVLDDSAKAKQESEALKKDIQQLDTALADALDESHLLTKALIDKSLHADVLEKQLQKAKEGKDTVTIMALADTCCFQNTIWRGLHKDLLRGQRLTDSLYILRVKKADSLATHWERKYDSCLSAVSFSASELPKLEPKGRVYFDITGMAGAITAFGGGLGYMDANGRIINVDVLVSGHGNIYQLRLATPLNFKRKQ